MEEARPKKADFNTPDEFEDALERWRLRSAYHPLAAPRRRSLTDVKRILSDCAECGRETYHDIVNTLTNGEWIESERMFEHHYDFVQCCGCESVSMIHLYAPKGAIYRYAPIGFRWRGSELALKLADALNDVEGGKPHVSLLREVNQAAAGGLFRVAAMGIRALIEQVMTQSVGDQGTFAENLDLFRERGYVSLLQYDSIKNILEVGHAAIHRSHEPSGEDVSSLLEITHGILEAIFLHPDSATRVANRAPPRRGRLITDKRRPE